MEHRIRQYLETARSISDRKSTPFLFEFYKLVLHRAVTGYGPDHYATYSLFDKPISLRGWREYVDKKDFCKILRRHNKKENFRVLEDKVLFGQECLAGSLPHPRIYFTVNYPGNDSTFPNAQADGIEAAFDDLAQGHYIVKTYGGSYGINLWSITKMVDGIYLHNDQTTLTSREFSVLLDTSGEGYLVQEKLEAATSLRNIMPGIACGSIRIHTFLAAGKPPRVPNVLLKLTVADAITDNFADGASGNMLALVDIGNRRITKVIRKAESGLFSEVTHHPDTKVRLVNHPLPELQEALELAEKCSLVFHEIPMVGWDIVMTDEGVKVLEGNPMLDPAGPQLAGGRGMKAIIPDIFKHPTK